MSEVDTGALGPGRIEPRELEQEMRSSYLDYAMSVIVGRALPDVRDGLKPVHRRVLYSMWSNGNRAGPAVREVRQHRRLRDGQPPPARRPAIYDTLVRLAQPFSLRYPLVDGQGNFGSVDDDPPAAMRYTEARLARLAEEMLRELDSDTVDFGPNYDESKREPLVLPARFPNLLVNGSAGIAVGMATNMPPHHLGETIDAVVDADRQARRERRGPDEARQGPRLPDRRDHRRPLRHPRRLPHRPRPRSSCARAPTSRSCAAARRRSSSPSCPYGVKKGGDNGVIKKIADLVNDKVLTEISDLADHTRPHRHADPDRAEARRDPAGRAQQALQAHGAPDDVRLQRRRARRRRAADALAARAASRTTSTSSARSSRAARSTSCARPRSARTSSRAT